MHPLKPLSKPFALPPTGHLDIPVGYRRVPKTAPIRFPAAELDAEHRAREREAQQHTDALPFGAQTRMAVAIRAAQESGRDEGFRAGYRAGTHWGMGCGAIGGLLAGAMLTIGCLKLGMLIP